MAEDTPDTRWFFLCTADDLAAPNAFVTTRIGAIPLVAQNIKGALVAFRNVCTHRFAVIHDAPSGCGPLRCPYHGWSFDAAGVPVGVPFNPTDFQLDAEGRRRLALNPAALAVCGRLVFIRVATEGPGLDAQVGADVFARLADLSNRFHKRAPLQDALPSWEGIETANLRATLNPGVALRLDALPPPGAADRFARSWLYHPAHSTGQADVETPA